MPNGPARGEGERGVTLIEVLVVAVVLTLLVLITDRVFLTAYLASRTTQRAAEMQQNMRVAASRLRREIRESRSPAISCYPDLSCVEPSGQVVVLSARPSETASVFCLDVAASDAARRTLDAACPTPIPQQGTYAPVWQRHIGYYRSAAGELRRVVQSGPIALPMPSGSGQVLASEIASFTVSRTGRRLRLRLEALSLDGGGGGRTPPQEMFIDDTIELRNARPRLGA